MKSSKKRIKELKKNGLLFVLLTLITFFAFPVSISAALAESRVTEELRGRIGKIEGTATMELDCQAIHAGTDLIQFYKERAYAPIWVDADRLNDLGRALPAYLQAANEHGLDPEDYHFSCMQAMVKNFQTITQNHHSIPARDLADLDILMTDAFLIYASHLSSGKVDPNRLYSQWLSEKNKADVIGGLKDLVKHRDLKATLRRFAPPHQEYWDLMEAGKKLQKTVSAGGWPMFPPGKPLRPGDHDARIPFLRERLRAGGHLLAEDPRDPDTFDPSLVVAVKKFQALNGLEADAIVGPGTIAALNVPAEKRLQQIYLNMERWRWLPRQWKERDVIVNTASFSLQAWQDQRKVLSMKVIVGKNYQKTPVFSEQMTYLEINPYWNVPRSIATKEFLPEIKRNPGYLTRNHYELLAGWSNPPQAVNPWAVDWSSVSAQNFPYRIRQSPGPWNALGNIKFMFPNSFQVYLHDTPNRYLFKRHHRALSHGCIRVEKPLDLALLVLQDDPAWTRDRIENIIASKKRRIISLPRPWMVHIQYWTAWVDEDGQIHFGQDIYDRDQVLWQALNETKSRKA
jgi:murein L,D-transpeptidase YcbB/YkuD